MTKLKHREDIKAALRKNGTNLRVVSIKSGLNERAGSRSLIKPIPTANRAIAKSLGMTVHSLWPEWYDKRGQRIRKKRSSNTSTKGKR